MGFSSASMCITLLFQILIKETMKTYLLYALCVYLILRNLTANEKHGILEIISEIKGGLL